MNCSIKTLVLAAFLAAAAAPARATTWTQLDYPGHSTTEAYGISGNQIVGYANGGAFLYNITAQSWSPLSDPLGVNGTIPEAISGSEITGAYEDSSSILHGFLFNGTNYTTYDSPAGTAGSLLVGSTPSYLAGELYDDVGGHGFLYNRATHGYTTFDAPFGDPGNTTFSGISGNYVVGDYGGQGFIYDILANSWTAINDPPAQFGQTIPNGNNGLDVVGYYFDQDTGAIHGFLDHNSSYTNVHFPGGAATGTVPQAIDGSNIVGYIYGSDSQVHAFLAQDALPVPEPGSLALVGAAVATLLFFAAHRRASATIS